VILYTINITAGVQMASKESEYLYYKCSDRIDKDIEIAEPFLIGCIAYIMRERGERGVRQNIKNNLCINRYDPYIRELKLISSMCDDSISALITSSLDLSDILKQVTIMYEHSKDSDFNLVQPSTHRNKAKKASDMLYELSQLMKSTAKVKTDSSLF
jgi:hypothetical protein